MMKVQLSDGAELFYIIDDYTDPWTQPETIVLHHGMAKNHKLWYAWIPILAQHYRVVRFDMRGMGQSSVPAPGYPWSLEHFAQDLLELLDQLELPRVHLIGETVGGSIAMRFATLHQDRLLSLAVCTSPVTFDAHERSALAGRRVVIIDASTTPEFKIGEALPPAARPLLRDLGVLDRFNSDRHLPSFGNQSAWGGPTLRNTDFIRDPNGLGWHLDRPRFDTTLREAAQISGAEVRSATHLWTAAREGVSPTKRSCGSFPSKRTTRIPVLPRARNGDH